jgi:hypothetical protein
MITKTPLEVFFEASVLASRVKVFDYRGKNGGTGVCAVMRDTRSSSE